MGRLGATSEPRFSEARVALSSPLWSTRTRVAYDGFPSPWTGGMEGDESQQARS